MHGISSGLKHQRSGPQLASSTARRSARSRGALQASGGTVSTSGRGIGSNRVKNSSRAVTTSGRALRQGGVGGGGKHQNGSAGGGGGAATGKIVRPATSAPKQGSLRGAGSVSSLDSKLQHNNMVDLQQELERITCEKLLLETKVQELATYQSEVMALRDELQRLQDQRSAEVEQLSAENNSLRARLHDVAHSPLSDSEKEQLLLASTGRQHNSAPASITTGEMGDAGDTSCVTPEWDKQSSSSLSEVSVACLQDRIMQMEETHYSTNEELQATLQELADLQVQLTELQADNERLAEEKGVLLESLCRQTEKLEDSRSKVDTLQELLLHHGQGEHCTEMEQKLVELLKSVQQEREALLLKQEELNSQLAEARQLAEVQEQEAARLADRVRLLESTVDATHAERKQLDQELALAKEESSSRSIEISRLTTLLDNARAKIEELEQTRELGDKSELDELLDNARKEKDALESQAASLQEQLSRSQCETVRLRDQLTHLQEERKVMRNNAKSALSDLEYQRDTLLQENQQLAAEVQVLKDSVAEVQVQCQCHLEDKRQLKAVLSETQRHLAEVERKLAEQETALAEEKRLRQEENTEWDQYQSDLLMTVRVANDFKTEAQQELEKLVQENKNLREKVRALDAQVEKLKGCRTARNEVKSSLPLARNNNSSSKMRFLRNHSKALKFFEYLLKVSRKNLTAAEGNAFAINNVLRSPSSKYVQSLCALEGINVKLANNEEERNSQEKILPAARSLVASIPSISESDAVEPEPWKTTVVQQESNSIHRSTSSEIVKQGICLKRECTETSDQRSDLKCQRISNWQLIAEFALGPVTEMQSVEHVLWLEAQQFYNSASICPSQKPPPSSPVTVTATPVVTTDSSLLNSVQQEMRRQHKVGVSRQDSRLSVKSLIESIENATKQAKAGPGSRSSSTSSLSSIASGAPPTPTSPRRRLGSEPSETTKTPLRDQQQSINSNCGTSTTTNKLQSLRKTAVADKNPQHDKIGSEDVGLTAPNPVSILANKTMDFVRRNSYGDLSERKDPLSALVKNGGSKRNALLKWCQNKTVGYRNIDITNFSSSWNDGLALCAILHSYLPERVPYDSLTPNEKRRNFTIAFQAAESVGIPTTLNVTDMIQLERPDWQQVMAYVTAIYKHFET